MTTVTFDVTLFREMFPAFVDPIRYPDALLQMNFDEATCYISNEDWGGKLTGNCLVLALYLLTAHLTALGDIVANGNGQLPGIETSATIDKVSVTNLAPQLQNQWQFWLSTTPYGQRLFALLQVKGTGGWYIGGLPERFAIRKVGGTFWA